MQRIEKGFERLFEFYVGKINQQKEEKKELHVLWVEPRKSIDEKKVEVVGDDDLEIVKEEEVIEVKPNSDVAELEEREDDFMIEQSFVEQTIVVEADTKKEAIADIDVCLQVKKTQGKGRICSMLDA